jgi:putative Holliday junction resolvase
MKILGLDLGEKRIGMSISDETRQIAIPYGVLIVKPAPEKNFTLNQGPSREIQKIKEICQKERVGEIVIGLPLNLKGKEGKQAKKVQYFVEELKKEISLPIILEDERLTTKEAERILKEKGVKGRKEKIDTLSAVLILEQYLGRK